MTEDPRVTRSRHRVLAAAVDVLAERGYGDFSIDAVARRSGVARSTIYRLWPDRSGLVEAALNTLNIQPQVEPVEDPREAVLALLRHLDQGLYDGPVAACLPALVHGAERDEAVRDLHHRQNRRRRAALTRAVARVRPDLDEHDADLLAQTLAGALVYARLMTPARLTQHDLERLADLVLFATSR